MIAEVDAKDKDGDALGEYVWKGWSHHVKAHVDDPRIIRDVKAKGDVKELEDEGERKRVKEDDVKDLVKDLDGEKDSSIHDDN